jgi:ribosome maturation factor RimP
VSRRNEIASQVEALAAPIGARMGLEIVDVELVGDAWHPVLRVLVERDPVCAGPRGGGAGIEDCARLSEALGRELDLYDLPIARYTLEVASPGLDRALRKPAEFVRFAGRLVAVTLHVPIDGQRRFRGRLLGLVDGRPAVQLEDGREVRFDMDDIAQARLVVEEEMLRQDLRRSS